MEVAQPHARLALGLHVEHDAPALPELFDHHARVLLRHVHGQLLDGLSRAALLVAAQDDLRPGDGELVPLPPHLLDEDGQVQLARGR